MRKILMLYLVAFLLLSMGAVGAQSTTATSLSTSTSYGGWTANTANTYCNELFTDDIPGLSGNSNGQIVSNAFQGSSTTGSPGGLGYSVGGLALLIVVCVMLVLAMVYGIGYGFGIRKLVEFAKTEYLESFFNLILILIIAFALGNAGTLSSFFTSIAGVTQLGNTPVPTNALSLYSGICYNTITAQIAPSVGNLAVTLFNIPVYSFLQGISFTAAVPPPASVVLGFSLTLSPFAGVSLDYQLVTFLLMPVFLMFFIGVTIIFLFFIIFFLFPVFLYAGVLLRSFPWTRAAGGALLALFISFYIVLPALYYPILAFSANQVANAQLPTCSTSGQQSLTGTQGNCQASSGIWSWVEGVLSGANSFVNGTYTLIADPGTTFIQLIDAYISFLAFAVFEFVGFSIALIISFDLLEALGDLLGAPSLQSGRLLERLI